MAVPLMFHSTRGGGLSVSFVVIFECFFGQIATEIPLARSSDVQDYVWVPFVLAVR